MTGLQLFTVINIALLLVGLAVYLYIVSTQLKTVASGLEESADLVWQVKSDAEAIAPGLTSINTTGAVTAGALPLLYGMGEAIVVGATFNHDDHLADGVNKPAMGTRRSRLMEAVGVELD